MIDEEIIMALGSNDEESGQNALIKIKSLSSVSLEEAQILTNLFIPYFKSQNVISKTLANEAFISLKKLFPSLTYPQDLLNSNAVLEKFKKEVAEFSKTENEIQPPKELDENPKIICLLSSATEDEILIGLREITKLTALSKEIGNLYINQIISFLDVCESIKGKVLARSALGKIKELIPDIYIPAIFVKEPSSSERNISRFNESECNETTPTVSQDEPYSSKHSLDNDDSEGLTKFPMQKLLTIVFITFVCICLLGYVASDIKEEKGPKGFAERLKLAEQGNAEAQYSLGTVYYKGAGVPQDYKEAMKWYLKAAEQGDANAQGHIGLMYEKGTGVSQNYKEAMKWYLKAAEQGDTNAKSCLGMMYFEGKGVPKDYSHAYMWFSLASANSCRELLEKEMTSSQIDEGLRLTREWIEKRQKRPNIVSELLQKAILLTK